ncbi:hypothetical protein BC828DRAFT_374545 [Blastocladiella britannica]|nr:hypothetical protein BC828DRAFT_374545 [Blastocladiella britannica]
MDPGAAPTLAVYAVSGTISLTSACFLAKRAFPTTSSRYLPTDSSMRFMAIRCRALLAASLILLLDTASNFWYWSFHLSRWPTDQEFVWYRLLWTFTFLPMEDLITIATTMRCLVILLQHSPDTRRRLLYLMLALCLVIRVTSNTFVTISVFKHAHDPPAERDNAIVIPLPIAALGGFYPLSVIIVSFLSLRPPKQEMSSSMILNSGTLGGSATAFQAASNSAIDQHQHQQSLSSGPAALLKSVLHDHQPTSMAASSAAGARIHHSPPHPPPSPSKRRQGIQYQMCTIFVFMTVVEVSIWILAISLTFYPHLTEVHNIATGSLLASIGVGVESSFELLLKLDRARGVRTRNVDQFMETAVAIDP